MLKRQWLINFHILLRYLKMSAMPNIDEIKAASGSDRLPSAFKFLFNTEVAEDQAFALRMERERQQLGSKIEKRARTIIETQWYGSFDADVVHGLQGLIELRRMDRQTLAAFDAFIDGICGGVATKEEQLSFMEVNE